MRKLHAWRWIVVAALVATPLAIYTLLPYAGVPVAVATSVAVVIALKHLGVLAVLLAPLYALLRRRH
jgi:hypothetical protein